MSIGASVPMKAGDLAVATSVAAEDLALSEEPALD